MKNIWTNGCFDILHIGHIELLRYARSLGDRLIVGIDGDDRIKTLKGPSRPINNQNNRKYFLQSIKYVDDVVIFATSDELVNQIKKHNIDAIVIGDDYKDKVVIGSEYVNQIVFFPKISGLSTSNIINHVE